MKHIISSCVLLFSIVLNAGTDLKWVNEQIEAIKPPRSGISNTFIDSLKDPIRLIVPKSDKSIISSTYSTTTGTRSVSKIRLKPLMLEAIINKNAYINGKWYSVNDKIRGQKITLIDKNYVVIKYKKRKTRLFVNSKNKKIKITTR